MENRVILTKVRAKKYISLMKKWHLQYMSLDDLSLQSGITVEHIIEEFSCLDPMIRMLCDDYNVLDLLNSITMVSNDFELLGNGSCGKGYKEWVKTSVGGPYMKVTVKLG